MRRHEITTLADAKLTNHGLVGAPENLDNLAVGAAIAFNARDANHHAIAMHGCLGGFTGDIDVAPQAFDGMIGDEKPVAIAMHVQAADGIFTAQSCDYKMPGADFDELAAFDEPIQGALEFGARCELRA